MVTWSHCSGANEWHCDQCQWAVASNKWACEMQCNFTFTILPFLNIQSIQNAALQSDNSTLTISINEKLWTLLIMFFGALCSVSFLDGWSRYFYRLVGCLIISVLQAKVWNWISNIFLIMRAETSSFKTHWEDKVVGFDRKIIVFHFQYLDIYVSLSER